MSERASERESLVCVILYLGDRELKPVSLQVLIWILHYFMFCCYVMVSICILLLLYGQGSSMALVT